MAKQRKHPRSLSQIDLARLRMLVKRYNDAEKERHHAAVTLEACKLDIAKRYRLDGNESVALDTGVINDGTLG